MSARVSTPKLADSVPPAAWPRMRPRFTVELDCGATDVMHALRAGVARDVELIEGEFSERHAVLTLPKDALRFWSTHLSIEVEAASGGPVDGASATRVLGIFQPRPEIWTAYVFAIGILVTIGVFGAMVAIVQLTLGHGVWGLFASLIAGLVGGLVYTSTLVGQGLALGEMYHLRRKLDEYLEDARAAGQRVPKTAADSAQL